MNVIYKMKGRDDPIATLTEYKEAMKHGSLAKIALWVIALCMLLWISASLLLSRGRVLFARRFRVKITETTMGKSSNPLMGVLERSLSLEVFEAALKANPSMINSNIGGNQTMMTVCAGSGLTNHVRLLINYGGDAQKSMGYLADLGKTQAISLIEYCLATSTNGISSR